MNIHIRDLQIQLQQNELDDKNKTEQLTPTLFTEDSVNPPTRNSDQPKWMEYTVKRNDHTEPEYE